MAKFWKEPLDEQRHQDFMSASHVIPVDSGITDGSVYFVRECSFTFQFANLDQLRHCLAFFSETVHPGRRRPGISLEHYWHAWYERLPADLIASSKRIRIQRALERALASFERPDAG